MFRADTSEAVPIFNLVCLTAIFGGFDSGSGPLPNSALAGKFGYYLGYYGVGFGFWILVFEGVYRLFTWERRRQARRQIENQPTAELDPVPDTKPLDRQS